MLTAPALYICVTKGGETDQKPQQTKPVEQTHQSESRNLTDFVYSIATCNLMFMPLRSCTSD